MAIGAIIYDISKFPPESYVGRQFGFTLGIIVWDCGIVSDHAIMNIRKYYHFDQFRSLLVGGIYGIIMAWILSMLPWNDIAPNDPAFMRSSSFSGLIPFLVVGFISGMLAGWIMDEV